MLERGRIGLLAAYWARTIGRSQQFRMLIHVDFTSGRCVLAEQRQATILEGLEKAGAVTVAELAERFAVTGETIRRDLAKLADRGRLVRTHGGAVRVDGSEAESPFAVRRAARGDEKRAIGRFAAASIRAGDVIAIDASTTGLEVARQLPLESGAPVTVVSNGLDVVRHLAARSGVEVICTGGEFDVDGACFVGPIAEATLRRFAFDRAFVSCRGFDARRGASESSPLHAAIKRQMLDLADEALLLVDSSKVGLRSVAFYAEPSEFAAIVSDAPRPRSEPSADGDRWRVATPP